MNKQIGRTVNDRHLKCAPISKIKWDMHVKSTILSTLGYVIKYVLILSRRFLMPRSHTHLPRTIFSTWRQAVDFKDRTGPFWFCVVRYSAAPGKCPVKIGRVTCVDVGSITVLLKKSIHKNVWSDLSVNFNLGHSPWASTNILKCRPLSGSPLPQ